MAQDDCQGNSLNDTQGRSQEAQYSENNLGDANDSDGDVNNLEDNGDVSRSNDYNEQQLATPQSVRQESSSVNRDGKAQHVSKVKKR